MPSRVSPTEQIRASIDAMFADPDLDLGATMEDVARTVKTTAGPVTLKRPKVRGTLEAFSSRLLGKGVTRTNALEALVISGWVRGLSTRDIEAALAETLGPDAAVSKSTVSQICKASRMAPRDRRPK